LIDLTVSVLAVAAAIALGAGAGWICTQVRVPSMVQDLTAALIGWMCGVIASLVSMLLSAALSSGSGGIGAVSVGVAELILIGVPVVLILALVLRQILMRLARARPALAARTPIVLGAAGALFAALPW
jgi:hypothetical protein